MWSGQAATMRQEGSPIKFIPKEGGIGWADYWGIVKDAPNKELAINSLII